jgi:hypothetical protein
VDAIITWLLGLGTPGLIIIGLAWLYYNERKERLEITKMYMQLQLEIMEILGDAKSDDKKQ